MTNGIKDVAAEMLAETQARRSAEQAGLRNPTPIELAMGAASEYRELSARGDNARLPQIRQNILGWVGLPGGRLPRVVAERMGRPELAAE